MRGKYRDVILPMTVLRRLNAVMDIPAGRSARHIPVRHPQFLFVAAVVLAGMIWASGCGDATTEPTPPPPDPPRPTTVTVTPGTAQLTALGATVQLAAQVLDQNGQAMSGTPVSWTSSDASVATVDASGLTTAAGNGTATITATAGNVSGMATVTVAQEVGAVAVTPNADTLSAFGDTVRLSAEAVDANGHAVAGTEFAWASSDTLVATVDASGLVTAVDVGEAAVTATSSGVTGRADLTVVSPAPDLVFMDVSPGSATLAPGDEVTFTFRVRNKGTLASGATTIRAMRSPNPIISTRDTELRSYVLSSLAPSGERTFELTISVDPKSAPGTIYIGMCVDPVADESDARNNCSEGARLTIAGASSARESADWGRGVRVGAVSPASSSRSLRLQGNAG